MREETVEFSNTRGNLLRGRVHVPLGDLRGFVLFAHCFTCSAASRAAVTIARALMHEGLGVLRFDFTGLGESQGDFATTTFSSNVEDLRAAAAFLTDTYRAPSILVGHSLGGTAVLAAAPLIESCRAVVTIGAPAAATHVEGLLEGAREQLETSDRARVNIGGRPFSVSREFLSDLKTQDLPDSVRGLRRALLIMHSPQDGIVSIDNAAEIFRHALHPKSFVSLDDADHLLSRAQDSRYAAQVLASWASRYLEDIAEPAVATGTAGADPRHADGVRASTLAGGLATELVAGRFALQADEPEDLGGTDTGPTPYELLAGALASCTSMTLQMYAQRKQLALDEAQVRVRHTRVHAEDCADCESKTGRVERFERDILLRGELGTEQRQRLLEIADRCPVHRTLTGVIEIVTRADHDVPD
jgi:uncharacterized OsmC-like protein/pimeloyl-ACP methyl ester carboxylesterase